MTVGELAGVCWASCPQGTESYEALVQGLHGQGLVPEIRYQVADYATQLALVAADLTAALVPAMAQHPAPSGVRFLALYPALHRKVLMVCRANAESAPVRAALDALSSATAPAATAPAAADSAAADNSGLVR